MSKSSGAIVVTVIVFFLQLADAQILSYETKITVKVSGEDQEPIPDAAVKIAFGQGRQLGKAVQIEGRSNAEGLFSYEHVSDGHVYWGASKDGYYSSRGLEFLFDSASARHGRWEPWNPIFSVVLRKKIKPVPLLVKHVETTMPCSDAGAGFDLMIGDWTVPHGVGQIRDLVLTLKRNVVDNRNYDSFLEIMFSNEKDGFVSIPLSERIDGCEMWLPHLAPESGYETRLVWRMARIPMTNNQRVVLYNDAKDYVPLFYRVRSVTNTEGQVTHAVYGKITAFEYDPRETQTAYLRFTYYLNPNVNDRNLEYSGVNLFSDDKRPYPP